MKSLALVFVCAGFGAVARYGVGLLLSPRPDGYPWGTLAVNLVGCLAIGLASALAREWPDEARLAVTVGFLGGFTTFSSFGVETLRLLREGNIVPALGYVAASNVIGIGLCAFGAWLGGQARS